MQEAEVPSRLVPEPAPARPAVSPPVAFAILLAVIAAIGTIVLLTRPETPAPPATQTAPQPPDFSLTNEEAITRFEELNSMRISMYESRDLSLAPELLSRESPLLETARSEIKQLLDDGVVVEMNFTTKGVQVVENNGEEVVIRQTVIEAPTFRSESGKDLTDSPPQRRVVEWTLHLESSVWKLHDLDVLKSREAKS